MELPFDQICSATSGAIRMVQKEDGIHFCRFTQEQTELEHTPMSISLSRSSIGPQREFACPSAPTVPHWVCAPT